MKMVSVRYLKSGDISMEIPKEILEGDKNELVEYCQQKFENLSDYELKKGLSDYEDNTDDFFDETPEIEQIADIEDEYKTLYSTNVWDFYSDIEYAENILSENKNMAKYLEKQGLVLDEVSNICYGTPIKRGSIDVTFGSLWDEDTEIKALAKLNLNTGEVYNIVMQGKKSYDIYMLGSGNIRINDIDDDFYVVKDAENMKFAINPGSLSKINELIEEHNVLWANEAAVHKVTVNSKEFSFQLDTGAYDEPIQPFNGNVLIDDGENQFSIHVDFDENEINSIKEDVCSIIKEKYFTGFKAQSFCGISINSNDLLLETKNLLLDGNADWTPNDIGGLIFKKETLTSFLEDDYFDDKDKPSKNCIDELKKIIGSMKNASILYLQ